MNATERLTLKIQEHNKERVKEAYISVLKLIPLDLIIDELARRGKVSHEYNDIDLSPDLVLVDVIPEVGLREDKYCLDCQTDRDYYCDCYQHDKYKSPDTPDYREEK
ncbi:MAG: hypothetical protein V1932_07720 [Chloroflexota bacterium]